MSTSRVVLPVIVVTQLFCTSMWFAGNAVLPDILVTFHLQQGFLASLTSAVQFGFISGTLAFAVLAISDRFSPSRVFFFSSLVAATVNLAIVLNTNVTGLLVFRFLTGFFLAGIYPVGMKIASDHYREGLGRSLGFLVGALVVGTAFPHLLKTLAVHMRWTYVFYATSTLSVLGGTCILLFVPDGQHRAAAQKTDFTAFTKGFSQKNFRTITFGYFGHMWELYTFWAFVPVMLTTYNARYPEAHLNVPLLSFIIIASGGFACVVSGLLSQRFGARRIATLSLSLSCACCLVSPLFLFAAPAPALIVFLIFWGLVVIADSPLFSTMVAQSAPAQSRGTSLTIVNCIGFSITIVSIQFINALSVTISPQYLYMLLAIGPALGLVALVRGR